MSRFWICCLIAACIAAWLFGYAVAYLLEPQPEPKEQAPTVLEVGKNAASLDDITGAEGIEYHGTPEAQGAQTYNEYEAEVADKIWTR